MFTTVLRRSSRIPGRAVHNLSKAVAATPLLPDAAGDTSKRPRRGGQNLSERYLRLERSLRQKAFQIAQINDTPGPSRAPDVGELPRVRTSKPAVEMFCGFVVPEEPKAPDPDECCMSGCAVCVNDLYADSVTAYTDALAKLRNSLSAALVPEYEWPARIRPDPSQDGGKPRKADVTLSAFEAMEQALAAKRARADATS